MLEFCRRRLQSKNRKRHAARDALAAADAVVAAEREADAGARMTLDEISQALIDGGAHRPSASRSNLLAFESVTGEVRWRGGKDVPVGEMWLPKAEAQAFIAEKLPIMREEAAGARRAAEHWRKHGRPKRPG